MSERDDFLRAIRATPDDDAPRLIYADWLDENDKEAPCTMCNGGKGSVFDFGWRPNESGQCKGCDGRRSVPNRFAGRAALIRLQINHPSWFADETCLEHGPNKNTRGYFDALNWLKSLACATDFGPTQEGRWVWNKKMGNGILGTYTRGFISETHLTLSQFIEYAPQIAAQHPVTRWVLVNFKAWQDNPPIEDEHVVWDASTLRDRIGNPMYGDIPMELFDLLEGGRLGIGDLGMVTFQSEQEAISSVNQSCVKWANAQAETLTCETQ